MADPVPAEDIERIVGAQRHPAKHLARAVSAEQTVYVLHSHQCLTDSRRFGRDLGDCPFSLALDNGIRLNEWVEDAPVMVGIAGVFEQTRLVPIEQPEESVQ